MRRLSFSRIRARYVLTVFTLTNNSAAISVGLLPAASRSNTWCSRSESDSKDSGRSTDGAICQCRGQDGTDVALPVKDRLNGLSNLLGRGVLSEISVCSGSQRADPELLFRVHRIYKNPQLRLVLFQSSDQIQSAGTRHIQVDDGHVPPGFLKMRERILGIRCVPKFRSAEPDGQNAFKAAADGYMVIDQQNPAVHCG